MKISILTENHQGAHTLAEHGISYLIEYDGKKLLFDTGQSDMFLKNAEIMGISLKELDMIILSHGHFDHGNGLDYISGFTLLCHPGCFVKRYRKRDRSYIGLKNTRDELSLKFDLITSSETYKITEKIFFLGEVPRLTNFESLTTPFIFDDGMPDFVVDDSSLALLLPEGLFIVTGCGHAGIVNTIEHAKKVTGINIVNGIIGGLHLKENDNQTYETIKYLRENVVKHILPSHCTGKPALTAFDEKFNVRQVRTGDVFTF
jgi:7,8-dihydropterin-6-yl-methyl-4-(beta-D-ribofuranosyl)aminobenzene 5'-phosphate synthase